jgi:hypothetical protein
MYNKTMLKKSAQPKITSVCTGNSQVHSIYYPAPGKLISRAFLGDCLEKQIDDA